MTQSRIIEIYSGTLWEAEMVKSLLESAGINSFLKNSVLNSYALDPIKSEGVQVMIVESDLTSAVAIVEQFKQNRN